MIYSLHPCPRCSIMIPLLVDEENCCTSWSRPGKKHVQKRMARFVKLPYIVLQCMQKYCFVLFCWMCIRPPQIHELLTKLTNLVSCPRLVHGQQKQTKLPNQTNKRNGFPLTGSCMGSKRGSAGLESVAGEGVGEEEFLARFNRKPILSTHLSL